MRGRKLEIVLKRRCGSGAEGSITQHSAKPPRSLRLLQSPFQAELTARDAEDAEVTQRIVVAATAS